ncbi:L,D-transpeptidase [Camelimonas fluminis]|uniref:L,D-transpeptidase n=1 Tax=Camelimonas fluminis TaxID=1576911 RepID=A0ABV7UD27_9HYPH|nr:L,D-transpeptidase [Camelimonas fluminis]GHE46406.1 L,D-transpeptidase [Camelimonas fluminis]
MGDISRRGVVRGIAAAVIASAAGPALARPQDSARYFAGMATDRGQSYRRTNFNVIDPRWRRQLVQYYSDEPQGTVVVDTRHHFLYVIFENRTALRYGVSVGKEGFQWFGRAQIDRKAIWPPWSPPADMLKRRPNLPRFMPGGPDNPLGPRALYLYRDGQDTGYRLHGTTEPWSIGADASSGCIRMFPEDVIDLYQRCPQGTRVLVLRHIAARAGNTASR